MNEVTDFVFQSVEKSLNKRFHDNVSVRVKVIYTLDFNKTTPSNMAGWTVSLVIHEK